MFSHTFVFACQLFKIYLKKLIIPLSIHFNLSDRSIVKKKIHFKCLVFVKKFILKFVVPSSL